MKTKDNGGRYEDARIKPLLPMQNQGLEQAQKNNSNENNITSRTHPSQPGNIVELHRMRWNSPGREEGWMNKTEGELQFSAHEYISFPFRCQAWLLTASLFC